MQKLVPSIKIQGPDKITNEGVYTLDVKNFPEKNVVITWSTQRSSDDVEEIENKQWYNPDAKLIAGENGRSAITCSVDYYSYNAATGEYVLLGTKKAKKVVQATVTKDYNDDPTVPLTANADITRSFNASTKNTAKDVTTTLFNKKKLIAEYDRASYQIKNILTQQYPRNKNWVNRNAEKYRVRLRSNCIQAANTWNRYAAWGNQQRSALAAVLADPKGWKGLNCVSIEFYWDPNGGTIASCIPYWGTAYNHRMFFAWQYKLRLNLFQFVRNKFWKVSRDVITHELGHAIGLTITNENNVTKNPPGCIYSKSRGVPYHKYSVQANNRLKSRVRKNWKDKEGKGFPGNYVALDIVGGDGTAGAHWSAYYRRFYKKGKYWSLLGYQNELMGGYADPDVDGKLTELSLAYLIDRGYKIKNKRPERGLILDTRTRKIGAYHSGNTRFLGNTMNFRSRGLPILRSDLSDPFERDAEIEAQKLLFLSGNTKIK